MFRSGNLLTAFLLTCALAALPTCAFAAACCGGGSLAPQIVAGDFRGQLNSALSLTHVTISSAWAIPRILDDRLQISAQVPLAYSLTRDQRGIALGDLSIGANVELLRNWEQSGVWANTDILGFVGLQAPTGLSIYQITTSHSQISGGGFYRLSMGAYGARILGDFDLQVLLAVHRDFARRFIDGSGDSLFVDPGFGAAATLGAGFSPGSGKIRLGLQASPLWEQGAVSIQPGQSSRGQDGLSVDLGASFAWLIDPTWTLAATYTEPVGTLARDRNIALLLQKRWWR